jgi:hypothetical protein
LDGNKKTYLSHDLIFYFTTAGMSDPKGPLDDYVDSDPEGEIPKELADKLLEDEGAMETDQVEKSGRRTTPAEMRESGTQTDEPPPQTVPVFEARSRSLSTTSSATLRYSNNSYLPKAYYNIQVTRESERTVRRLNGGAVLNYDSICSFATIDCGYSPLPNYRHNYAAKQNMPSGTALKWYMARHSC